jgi:hypothetical protein
MMRDEPHDFIETPPKHSAVLQRLASTVFCLTLFLSCLLVNLTLSEVKPVPLLWIGVIFFVGCMLVLIILNIMICTPLP